MVRKDQLLDLGQGRPRRPHLGNDVDAVPVLLHHLGETSNLSFGSREAAFHGLLGFRTHCRIPEYIPRLGIEPELYPLRVYRQQESRALAAILSALAMAGINIVALLPSAILFWRFVRTGGPEMLRMMDEAPADGGHHHHRCH